MMTRMATPTTTKIEGQGNARIPPHDLEAEMSLLGSMMLSREAIEMAVPILGRHEAHRLYLPDHQELYAVLVDLYDQAKPIDLVVVKDELQRRRKLEVQSVGSWVHAEHYAAIVRDKSLLRDLIGCAGRMIEAAYEHTDQAREILDRAEKTLFEVTERRITQQAVSLGDMLTEVYRLIESGAGAQVTGVPTGFIELDEISCGLQPGELVIVAARPSMGKTALGLNMAERMAVDERLPTVFFSMEMGRQQVAQRILCARGRVDSHKMRRGMLSEGEIAQLGYVCQALEGAPLLIDDTPGMSLLELRAKVRRLRMQKKVACVLASGKESRQLEIAYISRGLKALARELHIPVVAMAQLNRATEAREGHRPRMSDLRESGAIEQDADVVMLLHREEYYRPQDLALKGQAELIIAKQRNGPTGTIKLHFNKQLTRFDNLSVAPEQAGGRGDPDEAPF
jgi:replicative DNA helicase